MHRISRVFRHLLLLIALLQADAASGAAFFEFTLPFFRESANGSFITHRVFNTHTGPADGQRLFTGARLVPTAVSNTYLGIEASTLIRVTAAGLQSESTQSLELNDWPTGITYDSQLRRNVLVTLGGEGFLYQRSSNGSWSMLQNMHGEDLESLVYFPPQNAFWGLRVFHPEYAPAVLVKYNALGVKEQELSLGALPVHISPGAHHSELVAVGSKIVLLVEPAPWGNPGTEPSRIYVIDPAAGSIELTFEARENRAPLVRIEAGAPSRAIKLGESIHLSVSAQDPEGSLSKVELQAAGILLKRWELPYPTNNFAATFAWKPERTGSFHVIAKATDVPGATGQSPSYLVTVEPVIATNIPPWVRFTSPTNNATFTLGTGMEIRIEAFDPENALRVVDLFDGSTRLHRWLMETDSPGTNHFSFNYAPTNAGTHNLRVTAADALQATRVHEISVIVRTNPAPTSFKVTRALPDLFFPGEKLEVALNVEISGAIHAWAVEDRPPEGWAVSQITEGGAYDPATKKVKWGPIMNNQSATLRYSVTAPTNATVKAGFLGYGSANGASTTIVGDQAVSPGPLQHPADVSPRDWKITLNEVTAYAAAWKQGAHWQAPPAEIPLSYVTRAGFLWRSGEVYRFQNGLPPNCWVPSLSNQPPRVFAMAASSGGQATRHFPSVLPAGGLAEITLRIRPAAGVLSYGVEEQPPQGWTRLDSNGAPVSGPLRLGPFFDAQERTFTYTAQIPARGLLGEFAGQASFDGSTDTIQGAPVVAITSLVAGRVGEGNLRLQLQGMTGAVELESTSDLAGEWVPAGSLNAGEAVDIGVTERQRFYRIRVAEAR